MIDGINGLRRERILASPRFIKGRFRNTARVTPGIKGNSLPVLGEYFFGGGARTPPAPLPLNSPLGTWLRPPDTGLRATWLGHSTLLLEIDGYRVLTDPVFGERASPFSFAGPKRFHRPPVTVRELPTLDAVLVSHDHYDHLCHDTIRQLAARDVPFVTSLGVGARLERWGVRAERITELDWWEDHRVPETSLTFTAAPAQHFSGRGMNDRNLTLWSSFRIQGDRHRVYFSGDSGFTEEFADIGRRLGPFDLVLLEIGAYHPSWGDIHLGPEGALRAHTLIGSGALLPVHWGTFNLALHDWNEPAETLFARAAEQSVRLLTPELGGSVEPARAGDPQPWWRRVTAGSLRLATTP